MSSNCFLLIGTNQDLWCAALAEHICSEGHNAFSAPAVFGDPCRFEWKFDNTQSNFDLEIGPGQVIHARDLSGVFVASSPWFSAQGWSEIDLGYVQAEASAAFLGWLSSLPCKVLNRYPASIWYRQTSNLLEWARPLREAGLCVQPGIITNDIREAHTFAGPIAVYNLLGSSASFLVASKAEWSNLAGLMQHTHAHLTRPHGPVICACVLGKEIVWTERPRSADEQEAQLIRFAKTCGSSFIEVVFVEGNDGLEVIAVDPFPVWNHFSPDQTRTITTLLYALLKEPEELAYRRGRVA